MPVRVEFHPRFASQYEALAELAADSDAQWEVFAEVTALVNALGDKTRLGNDWYPAVGHQVDNTMVGEWVRTHPTHKAGVRRTR